MIKHVLRFSAVALALAGLALQSAGLATPAVAAAPPATTVCIIVPDACKASVPASTTLDVTFTASTNKPVIDSAVTFTAAVTSSGQDTINYSFYCDRPDTGTNVTQPYSGKKDATTATTYTAPCSYGNAGKYTAKIIVERGGLAVQKQIVMNVGTVPGLTLTATPATVTSPSYSSTLKAQLTGLLTPADLTKSPVTSVYAETPGATTTPAAAPAYEIQSGAKTLGSSTQYVAFPQKFQGGAPDSVVVARDYSGDDVDNYYVTNITDTGFYFNDSDARAGYQVYWVAVRGKLAGTLQAGKVQFSQANRYSVNFPNAFSGNASDISVILTRGGAIHNSNDQYLNLGEVSNTGFTWGGDATDRASDYPMYWVALKGSITLPGESAPAIQGARLRQSGDHTVLYPKAFKNPASAVVISKNWNASHDQMLGVYISPTASEARVGFWRGGDGYEWAGYEGGGLLGGIMPPRYNFWIATDRPYINPNGATKTITSTFSVNKVLGTADFKPTFNVSIGGTAKGDVNYILTCGEGTQKKQVRTTATTISFNDCVYKTAGTKTVQLEVQRDNAPSLKSQLTLNVVATKFTFYKDRSDSGVTITSGDGGITQTVNAATASQLFTYDPVTKAYSGKVIVEQDGATPIEKRVAVSVQGSASAQSLSVTANTDNGAGSTFVPKITANLAKSGNDAAQTTAYYFFCDEPNNNTVPSTSGKTAVPNPPTKGLLTSSFNCPSVSRTTSDQTKYAKVVVDNGAAGRRVMGIVGYIVKADQLPIATITSVTPSDIVIGAQVTINITATDANDAISKVVVMANGTVLGNATHGTGSAYGYRWTPAAVGNYAITVQAYDSVPLPGPVSNPSAVTVADNGGLVPPVVTFNRPVDGSKPTNAAVPLEVGVTVPAGTTIETVKFYEGTTLIGNGTLNGGVYTFTWNNVPAGFHRIKAVAKARNGTTGDASTSFTLVLGSGGGDDGDILNYGDGSGSF